MVAFTRTIVLHYIIYGAKLIWKTRCERGCHNEVRGGTERVKGLVPMGVVVIPWPWHDGIPAQTQSIALKHDPKIVIVGVQFY